MDTTQRAPGRAHRQGLSLVELMTMLPTEEAATVWFEGVLWADGRCCGKCGSVSTSLVLDAKPMPYWCTDCRGYFSVRTGTVLARSNVPLRKWAIAIYLYLTSLKSVSSMKLHRDLNVSQKTAWFMLHRLREAWRNPTDSPFAGPIEVDEMYMGGKERNKHAWKKLHAGGGSVGKTPVIGAKDRKTKRVTAQVIPRTDAPTLAGLRNRDRGTGRHGLHRRPRRLRWTTTARHREAFRKRVRQRDGPSGRVNAGETT